LNFLTNFQKRGSTKRSIVKTPSLF